MLYKTVDLEIILTFYCKERYSTPFLINKGTYSTALNTYSWSFGAVFSLCTLLSTLDCGIARTACFCVSLVFDLVWEERRCAEIHVCLWDTGGNYVRLQSPVDVWTKKVGCGFLNPSTWIVFLHLVCKKFHLWLLWVFWLFATFFILWLHILAMELCQILSPHPKPIISSAFSPLSFLAAGSSQNSSELASRRLVQSGPRAEFRKQNKTVGYFNQVVVLEESSFSLILCSIYLQVICCSVSQHSSRVPKFGMFCLPAHVKLSSLWWTSRFYL